MCGSLSNYVKGEGNKRRADSLAGIFTARETRYVLIMRIELPREQLPAGRPKYSAHRLSIYVPIVGRRGRDRSAVEEIERGARVCTEPWETTSGDVRTQMNRGALRKAASRRGITAGATRPLSSRIPEDAHVLENDSRSPHRSKRADQGRERDRAGTRRAGCPRFPSGLAQLSTVTGRTWKNFESESVWPREGASPTRRPMGRPLELAEESTLFMMRSRRPMNCRRNFAQAKMATRAVGSRILCARRCGIFRTNRI